MHGTRPSFSRDNFYSKGVKSVDDPQFKSTFEEQFTAPSLDVPWYVCAGNHDYYGGDKGIEAEIAYSAKSSRWKFPDYYFAQDITAADGTTITLLSVDTWRLNGGDTYVAHDLHRRRSALRVPTAEIERRHQAGEIDTPLRDVLLENYKDEDPNDPIVLRDDPDQLTWIDTTLAASTADWKIVMGHFPIHSYSENRTRNLLVPRLLSADQKGMSSLLAAGARRASTATRRRSSASCSPSSRRTRWTCT